MSRSILIAPWLVLALLIGATERELAHAEANLRGSISPARIAPDDGSTPFLAAGGVALDAAARTSGSAATARTAPQSTTPWPSGERIAPPQASASRRRYLTYARTLLDFRSGLPLTYGTPPPSALSC